MNEYTENENYPLSDKIEDSLRCVRDETNDLLLYIKRDLESVRKLIDDGESKDNILEALDETIDNLGA